MSETIACWCDRVAAERDDVGRPHTWGFLKGCPQVPVGQGDARPETPRVDPQTQALQAIAVGLADLGQAVAEIRDLVATKNGMATAGSIARRREPILPVERIEDAIRSVRSGAAATHGDGWAVYPPEPGGSVQVVVQVDLLP